MENIVGAFTAEYISVSDRVIYDQSGKCHYDRIFLKLFGDWDQPAYCNLGKYGI